MNLKLKSRSVPNHIFETVVDVLSQDLRVIFAYLYGSVVDGCEGSDIDIAVYCDENVDSHLLSADLKIRLAKEIDVTPETFDIRIINNLAEHGDIFGLLYLKNVLTPDCLLVDRNPDVRAQFLYRYGLRYRECEGLIQEVVG